MAQTHVPRETLDKEWKMKQISKLYKLTWTFFKIFSSWSMWILFDKSSLLAPSDEIESWILYPQVVVKFD